MYYLIYGILYLISLLPFFVLYRLSDIAFLVIYYVFGYRRKIVAGNLLIAFPEKTDAERKVIETAFYRNLVDNFIETIKLLSLSDAAFRRRAKIDFSEVTPLIEKGLNIQFHSGHKMNWEYASLAISDALTIPWLAVYMRISAKPIDRLFQKIRARFGAVMVEKDRYQLLMPQLMKQQYALGLIADQNPAIVEKSYWLNFFNRPAPFLIGPEKGAVRYKTAVVFVNQVKMRRGYYRFECKLITEDGSKTGPGELTRRYRDYLESTIRDQPEIYLWSHRRWKRDWEKFFERRWVDDVAHP